ncbi:MAG TPA: 5-formyltetrahydrofolate cyclo-ligase [Ktedonobacterales bacterium]|nr:5-formyltetrahydrofolate cyclo-ligase [Ktedonobacterales bacterium]
MTMLTWEQIRRWRKEQRDALIERRMAIAPDDRRRWSEQITNHITQLLASRRPTLLGFYWPFRGEYDARRLVESLHTQGIGLALPVVLRPKTPLEFRVWTPGARLESGVWGIPIPADGEVVSPDVLLVPLVGFDRRSFRLGYGGGFYDRTLAAMPQRATTIGVGFALGALETIHPQQHDIAMDAVVTEQHTTRRE